jgi:branched-chain amino acid transport system ATP-binding protein
MLNLTDVNSYYGKSHILHDVTLSVERGNITVLLGRNGAGKSTLIKSIVGLVDVRSGSITLRGEELTEIEIENRHDIGYIPEKRRVFPNLSVEENLQLAQLGVDDPREIDEIIDEFPNLQERRNAAGRTLSGGEQQMLSIARALIQDPELLLVDEPSEGLMPVLTERVFEFLSEISESGMTVLLTEQHAKKALDIADYSYIIDTGEVVEEGNPDTFEQQPELLEEYMGIHE